MVGVGMNLIVSLDTEADNQWDCGRPLTTENVRYWSPFQQVCERYGFAPPSRSLFILSGLDLGPPGAQSSYKIV
jgi:hypothetical protein